MNDQPIGGNDPQVISDPVVAQTKADQEQDRAVRDYGQRQAQKQPTMQVKVYSPFKDYYDGLALSLTAENATGPFDILPKHHNFISLLNPCDVIIRSTDKGEQRIRISGGILHVKADEVIVFLDV